MSEKEAKKSGYYLAFRDKEVDIPSLEDLARKGAEHRTWYQRANESVLRFAQAHDREPRAVASVLAVTSPRVAVSRNVRVTMHYFEKGALPTGVMTSHKKALDHWEATGEIRGPKTSAFRDAILGIEDAVVLDVWVARALRLPDGKRLEGKAYENSSNRIRDLAKNLGWPAAETQAAIWAGIRAVYGHKPVYLTFPLGEKHVQV